MSEDRLPLFCDEARTFELHRGPFKPLRAELGDHRLLVGAQCLACGATLDDTTARLVASAALTNRGRSPQRLLPRYDPYASVFGGRS